MTTFSFHKLVFFNKTNGFCNSFCMPSRCEMQLDSYHLLALDLTTC